MAFIAYENWNPKGSTLALVEVANAICEQYAAQGYDLTLRQLFYQFVSRDYLPNTQRSYKTLGTLVDRARRAGLMDWDYIVDRTRSLKGNRTYDSPGALIEDVHESFFVDLWQDQAYRIEVWVEKEALAGVIERAAGLRGVNFFSCRGYVSQSEMHAAAMRHVYYRDRLDQDTVIVHLGDHDPSGIDMTRDIGARMRLFGATPEVRRIALNWEQIEEFQPPPNPAKMTDSRAEGYVDRFGYQSWELDALEPELLSRLITREIDMYRDVIPYDLRVEEQETGRDQLDAVHRYWGEVVELVEGLDR